MADGEQRDALALLVVSANTIDVANEARVRGLCGNSFHGMYQLEGRAYSRSGSV